MVGLRGFIGCMWVAYQILVYWMSFVLILLKVMIFIVMEAKVNTIITIIFRVAIFIIIIIAILYDFI